MSSTTEVRDSRRRLRSGSYHRARSAIHLLNGLARAILLFGLILAPWRLGSVEPTAQSFIYGCVLASLGMWLVASVVTQATLKLAAVRLPVLLLPMLGGLCLLAWQLLQTTPVSTRVSTSPAHAPSTVAIEVATADHKVWFDNLVDSEIDQSEQFSKSRKQGSPIAELVPDDYSFRSLAVGLSRLESVRYGMAVIVFFLAVVLFQSQSSQLWLWGAITGNGAALVLFGVLQHLTWNGKLYWSIPLSLGGQPFASYVNANNAAGYLLLSLAAAVGLAGHLLMKKDWFGHCQKVLFDGHGSHSHRLTRRILRNCELMFKVLNWQQISAAVAVLAILVGILVSGSRSGQMSTVVAGVTSLFLLVRMRGEQKGLLAVGVELSLFMIGLVLWTGLVGSLAECWGGSDRRIEIQANWQDAWKVVEDFPVTGAGLGTYRFAYLPYQSYLAKHWFIHADNQFFEILVETGALGLTVVGILLLACLGSTLALVRNRQRAYDDPVGMIGTIALIGQAICACFDYGPSIPANLLTLAAVMGAITGRSARLADNEDLKSWCLACPGLRPPSMILLIGVCCMASGIVGWREVSAAAAVQRSLHDLPPRLDSVDAVTVDELDQSIRRLQGMITRRADDAETHLVLGKLWVYRYRLAHYAALPTNDSLSQADRWRQADLFTLYAAANQFSAKRQKDRLEKLRQSPDVIENLLPARWHFLQAQRYSPLLPEADLQLAYLEFLDPDAPVSGISRLERAIKLTPADPETLDRVANLAEAAALKDLAYGCWRRQLMLRPTDLQRIAKHVFGRISIQEQMSRILPDFPEPLLELATTVYAAPKQEKERRVLLLRVVELLTQQSKTVMVTSRGMHLMGRARVLLDEPDTAIYYYRQALTQAPMQLEWRLELVEILRNQGRFALALKQAELCLSVNPERKETRQLIEQLQRELPNEIGPAEEPQID